MLVLVHLAHVGAALSHRDAHLRRRALRRPSEDAHDGYRGPREPQTGSSTRAWNGSSPSNVCPASLPARRSRILGAHSVRRDRDGGRLAKRTAGR